MKLLGLFGIVFLFASNAFADHSLRDVMYGSSSGVKANEQLRDAVESEMKSNNISCNIGLSTQDYYYESDRTKDGMGTAWRQTSACLPSGTLIVSYTWVHSPDGMYLQAGEILELKFNK